MVRCWWVEMPGPLTLLCVDGHEIHASMTMHGNATSQPVTLTNLRKALLCALCRPSLQKEVHLPRGVRISAACDCCWHSISGTSVLIELARA